MSDAEISQVVAALERLMSELRANVRDLEAILTEPETETDVEQPQPA